MARTNFASRRAVDNVSQDKRTAYITSEAGQLCDLSMDLVGGECKETHRLPEDAHRSDSRGSLVDLFVWSVSCR